MALAEGQYVHAHKCETCALNGVNTLWIHGDCQKGDAVAHTCPRCGGKEWKATPVLVGKLPTEQNVRQLQRPVHLVKLEDLMLIGAVLFVLCVYGFVIYRYLYQTAKTK